MLHLWIAAALAQDTWTQVREGIWYLHSVRSDPNEVHALFVDLSRPEIWLRATREDERARTVGSFSSLVGATAAINGDFFDYADYRPLGVAVGGGWGWSTNTTDPSDWGFLACNVTKECWIDSWGTSAPWTPRWWNVVGGQQDRLVIDGVAQHYSGSYYDTDRHPRTAIGLSQDGNTMVLFVVDGRSSASRGMTWTEVSDWMVSWSVWSAIMMDGGGSSTLVINGGVVNTPSEGSQRTVSNHLAVMVSSSTDSRCSGRENSKYCVDGTRMATCEGGQYSEGDCGYYGLSCEALDDFAYCVDTRCAAGGHANFCINDTYIGGCTDGVYSEGDCAYYGAACADARGDAWCAYAFYQGSVTNLSPSDTLRLEVGETLEGWIELTNTGISTWTPGLTKLAPLPRDAASPFAASDWENAGRISTVEASTAPGAVGRFPFSVYGASAGTSTISLAFLEEGVTWFGDGQLGGGPDDGTIVLNVEVRSPGAAGDDSPVPDGMPGHKVPIPGHCGAEGPAGGVLGLLALALIRLRRERSCCSS